MLIKSPPMASAVTMPQFNLETQKRNAPAPLAQILFALARRVFAIIAFASFVPWPVLRCLSFILSDRALRISSDTSPLGLWGFIVRAS